MLHFDYVYCRDSDDDQKYDLVLKDDFSRYSWIAPTSAANAESAAETTVWWKRTFTAPEFRGSDQRLHFDNEKLGEMADVYQVKRKPTIASLTWVNGTVKQLNKDVLIALRAVIGDVELAPAIGNECWTSHSLF